MLIPLYFLCITVLNFFSNILYKTKWKKRRDKRIFSTLLNLILVFY